MNVLSRRKFLSASAVFAAGAFVPRLSACPRRPDTAELVTGNTAFGCELYGQLKSEPGNLFLSPFSVSTALGMTALGAKGTTLDEMQKVLQLPADAPTAFGAVLKSLNAEPDAKKRGFTLTTANALWAQQGYPWRPEFKKAAADDFGAGLFEADYKADPEAARAAINAWVEKQTHEKIKDLLAKGHVNPLTRLVLTNAIYFKGNWKEAFKKADTKDAPFATADGKKATVPLMYRDGAYEYAETDTYQMLDLPYVGGRVSMTVILPRKPDGLAAVEKELTGEKLTTALKKLGHEREVLVYLPKFKAESTFRLNEPLKALGMKAAFGRDADFGGMHTGGEHLHISLVRHKAFVDVNEEGTEAAAATAVVIKGDSGGREKLFRADRPFLYLIRDTETASVLFLGRFSEPAK